MERTKVDLKIQDYAPDWQNMSKQELAAVYGRIMDDIHSDKSVCEKKNNSMTGTVKWFDRKKDLVLSQLMMEQIILFTIQKLI